MTRTFCDLCDKPADAKREYRVQQNVGEPVSEYRIDKGSGCGCTSNWQCKIVVTASFKFVDHKDRETPDLCDACAKSLMRKLGESQ